MHATNYTSFTCQDLKSVQPCHWMVAYNTIYYNCCIIMLYRTRISKSKLDKDIKTHSVVSKCLEASGVVSYLIGIFLRENPKFHYICPFLSCFMYEIANTCLFISNLVVDPGIRFSCLGTVKLLLSGLKNFSEFNHLAKKYEETLNQSFQLKNRLENGPCTAIDSPSSSSLALKPDLSCHRFDSARDIVSCTLEEPLRPLKDVHFTNDFSDLTDWIDAFDHPHSALSRV